MPAFNTSVAEVSCPHTMLPAAIGNPQIVCRGCGCLIADHRHPANQAMGISSPVMLTRPEVVNLPKAAARRG